MGLGHAIGKVGFPGGKAVLFVMCIPVSLAIVQLLHQFGGSVTQVHRYGPRTFLFDQGTGLVVGLVDGIGLRRHCQIDHALRQCQLALGRAQAFIHLGGVQRHAQRTGVGQANVFAGHSDQSPRHITRICTTIKHANQPVQRGVGVRTPDRFVQSADGVVELLAPFVVAAHALTQHLDEPDVRYRVKSLLLRSHGQSLQRVEQAAGITVGIGDQAIDRYAFDSWQRRLNEGYSHDLLKVFGCEGLQDIDCGARQKS